MPALTASADTLDVVRHAVDEIQQLHPTETARPFALEDLFFSTTNLRGFITSCNPVFVRVSDYEVGDLVGAPHSIVRHPDMPRAVFKLLWDTMKAGQPLAAYVKNLAADGCYYWVMAVTIPIKNGYLSVRLKPSTAIQSVVEGEYRTVLKLEQALEAQGLPRSKVLEQSVPALLAGLAKHGFPDYATFQNRALPAEISSRRAYLTNDGPQDTAHQPYPDEESPAKQMAPVDGVSLGWTHDLQVANNELLTWISNLFNNLDDLVQINQDLAKRSHFLLDLAHNIHIFALNAGLAASILGVEGHALEAVTKQLQSTSKDIVRTIERATSGVEEAIRLIREIGFMISISTLQAEMVDFETQLTIRSRLQNPYEQPPSSERSYSTRLTAEAQQVEAEQRVQILVAALAESIQAVFDLSDSIASEVAEVSTNGRSLFALLDSLQFGLLAGRIEIARLVDRRGFVDMFSEISTQLVEAESEIKKFGVETANAADLIERFELAEGEKILAQLPQNGL